MKKLLDETTEQQVRDLFKPLQKEVAILYFENKNQNCDYCEDIRQLLAELTDLSDKLQLVVYDVENQGDEAKNYHIDKTPAFIIASRENGVIADHGIRYFGIPAGHEFVSLVRDILMVSSGDSGLLPSTRKFLATLDKPIKLQVFVTPTCPYCPPAVVLAHQMAMESPMVEAEMIEATEFPELSSQYGVSGVPHTAINNGMSEIIGSVPEQQLVEKLMSMVNN